jgi:NADH:ubiquinone oxidoreductase subunit H
MTTSIFPILILTGTANFINIAQLQDFLYFFILLPSFIVFFICILAETNRTPFDLPEAESELVAGYNVEYSSILFALFFLAEYCNIVTFSYIIVLIFFQG